MKEEFVAKVLGVTQILRLATILEELPDTELINKLSLFLRLCGKSMTLLKTCGKPGVYSKYYG